MTSVATPVSNSPSRVRIAITSPGILAHIRQVLAGKNLAVEFVHEPYVEVLVRPAAAASFPRHRTAPARHRLVAEYRLEVVEVGDRHNPVSDPKPADSRPDPASALSPRQRDVMALMSTGAGNREIAARLKVREKTVKNHINRILRVLGAANRVEAVLTWQRHQQLGHQQPGATGRGAQRPPLPAGRRRASRPPASAGTP